MKAVDEDGNEVACYKDRKHSKGNVFQLLKTKTNTQKLSEHWAIAPVPDNEQVVYVTLDKFEWSWGDAGSYSNYESLRWIRKYLEEIAGIKHIYGVKKSEEDKKIQPEWLSLRQAIRKYVAEFLVANPDKAQQIADRRAARKFLRNRWHSERMKESGSFFGSDAFLKWISKDKKGKRILDLVDPSSPFRIFMEHLSRMIVSVSSYADIDDQSMLEHLRTPTAYWTTGKDNEDPHYKKLIKLLPEPSFDLKKATLELLERYPMFGKLEPGSPNQMCSDAFDQPTTASVEYVQLVDAARDGR